MYITVRKLIQPSKQVRQTSCDLPTFVGNWGLNPEPSAEVSTANVLLVLLLEYIPSVFWL